MKKMKKELNLYAEEARQKWGDTVAYKQSKQRVKKMRKAGLAKVIKESGELTKEIAAQMVSGPKSEIVQGLIAQHYNGLRAFYDPSPEIYRGLANMYITDERFSEFFERTAKGLAKFMHDAMMYYADSLEEKK